MMSGKQFSDYQAGDGSLLSDLDHVYFFEMKSSVIRNKKLSFSTGSMLAFRDKLESCAALDPRGS